MRHGMKQRIHDSTIVRQLVMSIFGLNGRLVDTGNQLVQEIGLTTARWQVLGALGYSPTPLPVAHIARNMGLTRQSVQRVVDLLADQGLVRFEPNPHHQRAKLIVLTSQGLEALNAAEAVEAPLNKAVYDRIGEERIVEAIAVLNEMNEIIVQSIDTVSYTEGKNAA